MKKSVDSPRNFMKEVRTALGLTQEEFARQLCSSLSTVTKCEAQARMPRTHATRANFEQLAKRAGISLDEVSA
jgi:DNA-binding transcriptional regulator YiaG